MNRLGSGRSSLITSFLHGLQRPLQTGFRAVAQRDEGLSELLASGLHPQTRIMADTVDGAEDAVDGRQHRIDTRDRFPEAAVMVDEFGTVAAGDRAKMGDLTITAADIEETTDVDHIPLARRSLLSGVRRRCAAAVLALVLLRHHLVPLSNPGASPL